METVKKNKKEDFIQCLRCCRWIDVTATLVNGRQMCPECIDNFKSRDMMKS